ncbi:hypothetical protein [Nonomuraea roseola]|uniref:Uncharacterized protein n=1 Tax=Nonomuraea roseola TaxID=46179 RepID=A0ABV5PUR9_9ACTN
MDIAAGQLERPDASAVPLTRHHATVTSPSQPGDSPHLTLE